jgi:hypothetical protein
MKIGGVDPKTLPTKIALVIPRGSEHNIVFWAQGLADRDEFDKQVQPPKPPGKHIPGKGYVLTPDEPGYKAALEVYQTRWLGYLVVNSLKPSEIEWDTVKDDVPGTWTNWESDLKANGLSQVETNLVLGLVFEANSLDESKLAKAREVFLRGPQETLPS